MGAKFSQKKDNQYWNWVISLLVSLFVIVVSTLIFVWRNQAAFVIPNFYAEDGTIIFHNIYSSGFLDSILTLFNGYLIVGQYLLGYIAVLLNFVLGNDLVNLPIITAAVSCVFLGVVVSLPFLLFRKKLGTWLSLVVVGFTALVPMQLSDYAIIGTLGNLKFAFLYIAFLLIIFRTHKKLHTWQYVLVDILLLLCVVTNVTVAFLVPILLIPYLSELMIWVRTRKVKSSLPLVSAFVITALSTLYVLAALLRGIPKIPGYLDGPFRDQATLPIIERTIYFEWTYPFTSSFNSYFVGALLVASIIGVGLLYKSKKQERMFIIIFVWTLILGTGLFIINRPGIGDYYLGFGHKGGFDQFFYAQNMVAIFATGWLVRGWVKKLKPVKIVFASVIVLLYLLWAVPHGTSFGKSTVVYKGLEPIEFNLDKACREYANQPKVIIQIYPSNYWQWQVDKDLACKN